MYILCFLLLTYTVSYYHHLSSAMGKEIHRRVRSSRHVSPASIPLDRTTLSVNWSSVLSSLRRAHRTKLRGSNSRRIVPSDAPVVPDVPSADTGTPGNRTPLQLRRLLANVRFTGINGKIQGRIDHLIRAVRKFLNQATESDIANWWKRLHRTLPEPIFFVVYTSLKAVL